MMDRIMPIITDSADYITALSLLKAEAPLSKEEIDKLLALYAKYLDGADDTDYMKLCLAVDLLPGRTRADAADFAALELGDQTLNTLFTARDWSTGIIEVQIETARDIAERVSNSEISLPARVLLARLALDSMAGALNFLEIQAQVRVLAEFLTGVGPETLDRYTAMAREVRMKCQN